MVRRARYKLPIAGPGEPGADDAGEAPLRDRCRRSTRPPTGREAMRRARVVRAPRVTHDRPAALMYTHDRGAAVTVEDFA